MEKQPISATMVHVLSIETASTIMVAFAALSCQIEELHCKWIQNGRKCDKTKQQIRVWRAKLKAARAMLNDYNVEDLVNAATSPVLNPSNN